MTSRHWFDSVEPTAELTQGDVILECPRAIWRNPQGVITHGTDLLSDPNAFALESVDAIVMTQACDLSQQKVYNVVMCPAISLDVYESLYRSSEVAKNRLQTASDKAFGSHLRQVRNGFVWNLAMLNSGAVDGLSTDIRLVDFHDVFTVPRTRLEQLLQYRGERRLRLLPPYREHLSQAFARYFMRVGLPVAIELPAVGA